MPKRIHVEKHLTTEELEKGYREANDGVKRSHYQIVWLLSQGKLTREVTEATGYKGEWIRQIARRYNQLGEEGLGDRRHRNPGAKDRALLSPQLREELGEALMSPPASGGMWNSRKVAEWIAEQTGRKVGVQRGWEYLRLLGYTPQVPRPTHARADTREQEEFKGNSPSG